MWSPADSEWAAAGAQAREAASLRTRARSSSPRQPCWRRRSHQRSGGPEGEELETSEAGCCGQVKLFCSCPTHLDERRDNHLQRLLDHPEAVGVVQAQDVGAHEGEDGHDVVEDFLLQEETVFICLFVDCDRDREGGAYREDGGDSAQQQQGVVVSLWHVGRSNALNHKLHTELFLIQDVCRERAHAAEHVRAQDKTVKPKTQNCQSS